MSDTLPGIRDAVAQLPPFPIVAIAEYGRSVGGVLPLWFGESDRVTPAFIIDAAAAAMREGHTFYQPKRGEPALRDALARYMSALYGIPMTEDRLNVTASGTAAIAMALQAVVDPGRNVAMLTPVWPIAGRFVRLLGADLREVPLGHTPGQGWRLDLDRVRAAIDGNTAALFVNSPNNPTGWMASEAEYRALLEICRERGIWLVSDEVYARIVYDRKVAPSVLHVAAPEDRVLVINTFSKTWSMTGWRLGWLTSPPGFAEQLEKLGETQTGGPASFVQRAGITAITEGEPYIRALLDDFAASRARVAAVLESIPGIRFSLPMAGLFAYFAVEGETDGTALARRLIDQGRVGLAPGTAFGPGGLDHLRLCFASARPTLDEALDRLHAALHAR
jgi:aspartate/methionine/tyrosine aminotransferase